MWSRQAPTRRRRPTSPPGWLRMAPPDIVQRDFTASPRQRGYLPASLAHGLTGEPKGLSAPVRMLAVYAPVTAVAGLPRSAAAGRVGLRRRSRGCRSRWSGQSERRHQRGGPSGRVVPAGVVTGGYDRVCGPQDRPGPTCRVHRNLVAGAALTAGALICRRQRAWPAGLTADPAAAHRDGVPPGRGAGAATDPSGSGAVNTKKYGKKLEVQLRGFDKAGNVTKTSTRTWRR